MNNPFYRAPHVAGPNQAGSDRSGNAALLIDFDNVTMGIRSDLSRELRTLLDSEVIRGKVAVQRAYADWRRYPQYIVPLSESSIDLIFAPAYGSSKKNATDIRLAIDALELVFVRPEIGTFILLSGDSDFSSLVLKLKEYGKFVIGVGLQESSSDILVQNCDEYYSYNTLTGLTKTDEAERVAFDPWVLVEKAVERMVERDDVMRSDRLKQVMVEIDSSFEERKFGFAKFSKFLAEAAGKGLIDLRKLDNGQFEVGPGKKRRGGKRTRRSTRASRSETPVEKTESRAERPPVAEPSAPAEDEGDERPDTLDRAYSLMRTALEELREAGRDPARDSDVKRRLLKLKPSFDEAEFGFSKFSKFLRQAADDHIVRIERLDNGQYEVSLPGSGRKRSRDEDGSRRGRGRKDGEGRRHDTEGRKQDSESRKHDSEGRKQDGEGRGGGRGGNGRGRGRSRSGGRDEASDSRRESGAEDTGSRTESRGDDAGTTSGTSGEAGASATAESARKAPQASADASPTVREQEAPKAETGPPAREEVTAAPPKKEVAAAGTSDPSKQLAGEGSRAKGGLLPRSQKRGRGPEGPPPIFEGQAVRPPSGGSGGNASEA